MQEFLTWQSLMQVSTSHHVFTMHFNSLHAVTRISLRTFLARSIDGLIESITVPTYQGFFFFFPNSSGWALQFESSVSRDESEWCEGMGERWMVICVILHPIIQPELLLAPPLLLQPSSLKSVTTSPCFWMFLRLPLELFYSPGPILEVIASLTSSSSSKAKPITIYRNRTVFALRDSSIRVRKDFSLGSTTDRWNHSHFWIPRTAWAVAKKCLVT